MGKVLKKGFILCLTIVMFLSFSLVSLAEEGGTIKVSINGDDVQFNDDLGYPLIDKNSRTLVPFRATLEEFGASVSWDNVNSIAIAEKNNIKVEVPIGQKYILKNQHRIEIDTEAQSINSRTYLPIRAVLEAFGCTVEWNGETNTVVVTSPIELDENTIIIFKDAKLEETIRQTINKTEGDILYKDVIGITELRAEDKGIVSLDGIEYLTNLEKLFLFSNKIQDFTQLSNLKELSGLWIADNNISDISFLSGLVNLKHLETQMNSISDLTPLQNLSKLEYLSIFDNQISDLKPLMNLSKLEKLNLAYNQISDLSSFKNNKLNNLDELGLSNNNIEDISPLTALTNLKMVDLQHNNINDMSPLSKISTLGGYSGYGNPYNGTK